MTTTHSADPIDVELHAPTDGVLTASGIVKSYRRGIWPLRRTRPVLRGADLTVRPGEVVGLVNDDLRRRVLAPDVDLPERQARLDETTSAIRQVVRL